MIVSDPLVVPLKGKRLCVVVVNFTSVKGTRFDDLTCVFTPRDHSYFKHDSYVFYQKTDVEFADSLMQNVSSGIWKQQPDFLAADVTRIKLGLRNSPYTSVDIKNLPI